AIARPPLNDAAMDAATDVAVIVAFSSALIERESSPASRVLTPSSAFVMDAATSLSIVLSASETAFEKATPVDEPIAAAIDAAPTSAVATEVSCACRLMVSAMIPGPLDGSPSPLIVAFTSTAIEFVALAPAPLRARENPPLPETATEPAPTPAEIEPDS